MEKESLKVGDKVWCKMPMIDDTMAIAGVIIAITRKRIKCDTFGYRPIGFYHPKNVYKREREV
mgnify:FL=1|tara:strand:- start:953 stop:1141 length:189 start_codon:yes stop_codon:yes gene_type:complete